MGKILVIEDEDDIRENILEVLELEGFESLGAPNGRIGIQLAREHLPDLIVCDISMPEIGGHKVITALRNDPQAAMIPFIFLTARTTTDDFRKGMNLGADDYLTKPFELDDLLSAIQTRLKKHETFSEHLTQKMDELSLHLSYNLPHELRTPLTGIIGFSQLLIEFGVKMAEQNPEEIVQIGRNVFDSALRLHRLIENYLFYSELKLLQYQPDKLQQRRKDVSAVSMKSVIDSAARTKAEQEQRMSDLTLDLEDAQLVISEANLQKIVIELVDNACKFSRAGSPLHVSSRMTDTQFLLRVTNHGRGMTQEQISNIGAYKQFDRSEYEQQGSGLGLVIARLLTELHHGRLTIESVPEESTTVSVVFEI